MQEEKMNTVPVGLQPSPGLLTRMPSRHQRLSPLSILIFAFFFLVLFPGCLYIPQQQRKVELSGKMIDKAQIDFVVPGQTTKAEFIDKVGQPYLMLDDFGVMAYYWKMLAAYVPYLIPGYCGAAAGVVELSKTDILLVAYDDRGIIQKYEIIHPGPILEKTVNERALKWIGRSEILRKFSPITVPAGQAVVYIYAPRPAILDPIRPEEISGVFLDGKLWAELYPWQYTQMILPPGTCTIGLEPRIRASDKFLHPHRQAPQPAVTTTINIVPDQVYCLEIPRSDTDLKQAEFFISRPLNDALPKLAKLSRVR
jgi:hypothetical protein